MITGYPISLDIATKIVNDPWNRADMTGLEQSLITLIADLQERIAKLEQEKR